LRLRLVTDVRYHFGCVYSPLPHVARYRLLDTHCVDSVGYIPLPVTGYVAGWRYGWVGVTLVVGYTPLVGCDHYLHTLHLRCSLPLVALRWAPVRYHIHTLPAYLHLVTHTTGLHTPYRTVCYSLPRTHAPALVCTHGHTTHTAGWTVYVWLPAFTFYVTAHCRLPHTTHGCHLRLYTRLRYRTVVHYVYGSFFLHTYLHTRTRWLRLQVGTLQLRCWTVRLRLVYGHTFTHLRTGFLPHIQLPISTTFWLVGSHGCLRTRSHTFILVTHFTHTLIWVVYLLRYSDTVTTFGYVTLVVTFTFTVHVYSCLRWFVDLFVTFVGYHILGPYTFNVLHHVSFTHTHFTVHVLPVYRLHTHTHTHYGWLRYVCYMLHTHAHTPDPTHWLTPFGRFTFVHTRFTFTVTVMDYGYGSGRFTVCHGCHTRYVTTFGLHTFCYGWFTTRWLLYAWFHTFTFTLHIYLVTLYRDIYRLLHIVYVWFTLTHHICYSRLVWFTHIYVYTLRLVTHPCIHTYDYVTRLFPHFTQLRLVYGWIYVWFFGLRLVVIRITPGLHLHVIYVVGCYLLVSDLALPHFAPFTVTFTFTVVVTFTRTLHLVGCYVTYTRLRYGSHTLFTVYDLRLFDFTRTPRVVGPSSMPHVYGWLPFFVTGSLHTHFTVHSHLRLLRLAGLHHSRSRYAHTVHIVGYLLVAFTFGLHITHGYGYTTHTCLCLLRYTFTFVPHGLRWLPLLTHGYTHTFTYYLRLLHVTVVVRFTLYVVFAGYTRLYGCCSRYGLVAFTVTGYHGRSITDTVPTADGWVCCYVYLRLRTPFTVSYHGSHGWTFTVGLRLVTFTHVWVCSTVGPCCWIRLHTRFGYTVCYTRSRFTLPFTLGWFGWFTFYPGCWFPHWCRLFTFVIPFTFTFVPGYVRTVYYIVVVTFTLRLVDLRLHLRLRLDVCYWFTVGPDVHTFVWDCVWTLLDLSDGWTFTTRFTHTFIHVYVYVTRYTFFTHVTFYGLITGRSITVDHSYRLHLRYISHVCLFILHCSCGLRFPLVGLRLRDTQFTHYHVRLCVCHTHTGLHTFTHGLRLPRTRLVISRVTFGPDVRWTPLYLYGWHRLGGCYTRVTRFTRFPHTVGYGYWPFTPVGLRFDLHGLGYGLFTGHTFTHYGCYGCTVILHTVGLRWLVLTVTFTVTFDSGWFTLYVGYTYTHIYGLRPGYVGYGWVTFDCILPLHIWLRWPTVGCHTHVYVTVYHTYHSYLRYHVYVHTLRLVCYLFTRLRLPLRIYTLPYRLFTDPTVDTRCYYDTHLPVLHTLCSSIWFGWCRLVLAPPRLPRLPVGFVTHLHTRLHTHTHTRYGFWLPTLHLRLLLPHGWFTVPIDWTPPGLFVDRSRYILLHAHLHLRSVGTFTVTTVTDRILFTTLFTTTVTGLHVLRFVIYTRTRTHTVTWLVPHVYVTLPTVTVIRFTHGLRFHTLPDIYFTHTRLVYTHTVGLPFDFGWLRLRFIYGFTYTTVYTHVHGTHGYGYALRWLHTTLRTVVTAHGLVPQHAVWYRTHVSHHTHTVVLTCTRFYFGHVCRLRSLGLVHVWLGYTRLFTAGWLHTLRCIYVPTLFGLHCDTFYYFTWLHTRTHGSFVTFGHTLVHTGSTVLFGRIHTFYGCYTFTHVYTRYTTGHTHVYTVRFCPTFYGSHVTHTTVVTHGCFTVYVWVGFVLATHRCTHTYTFTFCSRLHGYHVLRLRFTDTFCYRFTYGWLPFYTLHLTVTLYVYTFARLVVTHVHIYTFTFYFFTVPTFRFTFPVYTRLFLHATTVAHPCHVLPHTFTTTGYVHRLRGYGWITRTFSCHYGYGCYTTTHSYHTRCGRFTVGYGYFHTRYVWILHRLRLVIRLIYVTHTVTFPHLPSHTGVYTHTTRYTRWFGYYTVTHTFTFRFTFDVLRLRLRYGYYVTRYTRLILVGYSLLRYTHSRLRYTVLHGCTVTTRSPHVATFTLDLGWFYRSHGYGCPHTFPRVTRSPFYVHVYVGCHVYVTRLFTRDGYALRYIYVHGCLRTPTLRFTFGSVRWLRLPVIYLVTPVTLRFTFWLLRYVTIARCRVTFIADPYIWCYTRRLPTYTRFAYIGSVWLRLRYGYTTPVWSHTTIYRSGRYLRCWILRCWTFGFGYVYTVTLGCLRCRLRCSYTHTLHTGYTFMRFPFTPDGPVELIGWTFTLRCYLHVTVTVGPTFWTGPTLFAFGLHPLRLIGYCWLIAVYSWFVITHVRLLDPIWTPVYCGSPPGCLRLFGGFRLLLVDYHCCYPGHCVRTLEHFIVILIYDLLIYGWRLGWFGFTLRCWTGYLLCPGPLRYILQDLFPGWPSAPTLTTVVTRICVFPHVYLHYIVGHTRYPDTRLFTVVDLHTFGWTRYTGHTRLL